MSNVHAHNKNWIKMTFQNNKKLWRLGASEVFVSIKKLSCC